VSPSFRFEAALDAMWDGLLADVPYLLGAVAVLAFGALLVKQFATRAGDRASLGEDMLRMLASASSVYAPMTSAVHRREAAKHAAPYGVPARAPGLAPAAGEPAGRLSAAGASSRSGAGSRAAACVRATRAAARSVSAAAAAAHAAAATAGLARVGVPASPARQRRAGERLARRLERLGGAYLKAGQLLSTRDDLLPADVRSPLARLCDDVRPAAAHDGWLHDVLGSQVRAQLVDLDPVAVAAGSVTRVHRARRADDGEPVAVKVLRPDVAAQFTADLMLMRAGAGVAARIPLLRSVPVAEATRLLTSAIAAHLDLAAEARHHTRLQEQFACVEGVVVPRLHRDLCTPRALVMAYVDGRRIDDPGLDPELAHDAVLRTLRCLYAMLFDHGLVHCDLHPGNVRVTAAGEVVLLDFGYVAQLRSGQQQAFAKLFVAMARADAGGVTEVIVDTALSLPAELDRAALTADLGAHVALTSGATAGEFNIARFVAGLFAIQHRHRIVASPEFAMSIVALMTLEGVIKQITPGLDFQREALPFVLKRIAVAA
jgi:ubiquinone biosynthesis protein